MKRRLLLVLILVVLLALPVRNESLGGLSDSL